MGGGVMQIDHGEPGAKVPPAIIASSGIFPIAGLASGGTGTLITNWRRNFPSPSKHLDAMICRGRRHRHCRWHPLRSMRGV